MLEGGLYRWLLMECHAPVTLSMQALLMCRSDLSIDESNNNKYVTPLLQRHLPDSRGLLRCELSDFMTPAPANLISFAMGQWTKKSFQIPGVAD